MTPARERTEAAIRDYGDAEYHRALGNNSFQDAMDTKKDLIDAIDAEVKEERARCYRIVNETDHPEKALRRIKDGL